MNRYAVRVVLSFPADVPDTGYGGEPGLNPLAVLKISRRVKRLIHKLVNVCRVNPCCPEPDVNFRRIQVFGLDFFECGHINGKCRIFLSRFPGGAELFSHVSGKIVICRNPTFIRSAAGIRIFKNHPLKVFENTILIFRPAEKGRHIVKINTCFFTERYGECFACRVNRRDNGLLTDSAFCEHVGLALQFPVLINDFQGAEQTIRRILLECPLVGAAVD